MPWIGQSGNKKEIKRDRASLSGDKGTGGGLRTVILDSAEGTWCASTLTYFCSTLPFFTSLLYSILIVYSFNRFHFIMLNIYSANLVFLFYNQLHYILL